MCQSHEWVHRDIERNSFDSPRQSSPTAHRKVGGKAAIQSAKPSIGRGAPHIFIQHHHSDVCPCFRVQIAAISASMSSQVL
jgi:hypothetical protein